MPKGSHKKKSFSSGQSAKALSTPPLGLVVKRTATKKSSFLSGQPLTPMPPLLVDCQLKKKKKKLFCGFPNTD